METISIRRAVIESLSACPSEVIKVFLVLCERSQLQEELDIGLTSRELARTAGVSEETVAWTLDWLKAASWIDVKPFKKHETIHLAPHLSEGIHPIPFTRTNTDETKIAKVESEMRKLVRKQQNPSKSGLDTILQGEARDLVLELENKRGTALSVNDIWNLASMIAKFGPERAKKTIRQMESRRAKDSIRAAYGALLNGAKGKEAEIRESEPFQVVKIRDLA